MLRLLIARHGNTFDKGDTLLRVGKGTDLPLSISGSKQATALGRFLSIHHPTIDQVFTSNLQRTQQTATIALEEIGLNLPLIVQPFLDEVDYGPDEGKPEGEVIARIGQEALLRWEKEAIPPSDWLVNPVEIIQQWLDFSMGLLRGAQQKTALVVTSNGIARFAPYILGDYPRFTQEHSIKLSTGALACLEYDGSAWALKYWNHRPTLLF
jgi:2,3-bisphosphoglycerate-dependent phosphoglycerate mutase